MPKTDRRHLHKGVAVQRWAVRVACGGEQSILEGERKQPDIKNLLTAFERFEIVLMRFPLAYRMDRPMVWKEDLCADVRLLHFWLLLVLNP
jgi:hypothetical protein